MLTIVAYCWLNFGWDKCDTPHNYNLLENILHYQNGILLLAFSADFSVASIVCLAVW